MPLWRGLLDFAHDFLGADIATRGKLAYELIVLAGARVALAGDNGQPEDHETEARDESRADEKAVVALATHILDGWAAIADGPHAGEIRRDPPGIAPAAREGGGEASKDKAAECPEHVADDIEGDEAEQPDDGVIAGPVDDPVGDDESQSGDEPDGTQTKGPFLVGE